MSSHIEPLIDRVYFDKRNIIFIHPGYIDNKEGDTSKNIKYVLWSVGCIMLKYLNKVTFEDMLILHRNYDKIIIQLACLDLDENLRDLILICLTYDGEKDFTELFLL